ncbi:hypothetical protein SSBR45G_11940 [Bradyrhizobium sp. SSBR45G]|uniref:hypothetical protein n=1 Tax=unclassified Bradyrhizobium TaxID=2631580 RepID=UPI002342BC65|nr:MULTISPECIES: hypothetical protein [unclassified Bradyrhizobium]GLH76286.1 hypothetical protein SSBR45G_11940 [Bradyrhizobium sp. SSBR45G]GLH83231.1 hypothetical protein SSBR45R_06910 [Bradyrhizobium sp. SSBR45R]
MTLSSGELAQIVWAETKALGTAPADGSGSVNGVRRLVAQLAASEDGKGFERRDVLPSVQDRDLGGTVRAILSIAEDARNAAAPQSRIIIWEADGDSLRLNTATSPPPPAPWADLAADKITHQLHQGLGNGQTVDVFARDATTDASAAGAAVFVNAMTGTGVPGGSAPMAEPRATSKAMPRTGVLLFVVALALFVLSALGSYGIGVGARLSLGQFLQSARIATDGSGEGLDCTVATAEKPNVLDSVKWRPKADKAQDCRTQFMAAQSAVAAAQYPAPDAKPGSNAIRNTTWPEWFAGKALEWSSLVNGTMSLVVPFCLALLSLLLLFIACGFGITGRALGPIIDERNRMSLTLAQLAIWSIVLLSGLLVCGLFNYGFGGLLITELQQQAAAATLAKETPNPAKSALEAYNLFPSIPFYLALVGGFAVATPFLSRLISNSTVVGTQDQTAPDAASPTQAPKYLADKAGPEKAALSDMVLQEVKGRSDMVDINRVQHVAITGILSMSYLLVLFDVISNIDAVRIVFAAALNASVLTSMPQIDGTFTSLLFVSHAALLGSKVYDKMVPAKREG